MITRVFLRENISSRERVLVSCLLLLQRWMARKKKKKSVNEPKFRHVAKTKKNQKIEKGRYSKGKM